MRAAPCAAATPPAPPSRAPARIFIALYTPFDLRVTDHPALAAAAAAATAASTRGGGASVAVVPLFLWSDPEHEAAAIGFPRQRARVSEVWVREALKDLDASLRARGSRLVLRRRARGPLGVCAAISGLVAELRGADDNISATAEIFTGIRFEPTARAEQNVWRAHLERKHGILVRLYNTTLLHDPRNLCNSDSRKNMRIHWGTLMHFIGLCRQLHAPPPRPVAAPSSTALPPPAAWPSSSFSSPSALLGLPKDTKLWDGKITSAWTITELAAIELHDRFVSVNLKHYERNRNRADVDGAVSRLSPYIRHGQISPRTIYWSVLDAELPKHATKTFGRRLFWRDLAYFQLDKFPNMHSVGIRRHYDHTEWRTDAVRLKAWKSGRTGFPMVDAGMRELYATGYMQQNVRMVAASFLVEYLGMWWGHGMQWFHDCLVDADLAINSMMWQNAGRSGIDQWNFVLRPDSGASRDPSGKYVKQWVPELSELPAKHIFAPWHSPPEVLRNAGVTFGDGRGEYPVRIVRDLVASRQQSSEAVLAMRRANQEFNDSTGYDVIKLPSGATTKVFTKKEYRIDRQGRRIVSSQAGRKKRTSGTKKPQTKKKTKKKKIHKPPPAARTEARSEARGGKKQTNLNNFFKPNTPK